MRALNRVSTTNRATWERDHEPAGFQWLDADDVEHSVFGFLRWSADGRQVLACLANFTPVPRDGYRVGLPWGGEWRVLLDTNAQYFGGTGYGGTHGVWAADGEPHQGQPASAFLTLPPLERGVARVGCARLTTQPRSQPRPRSQPTSQPKSTTPLPCHPSRPR